MCQERAHVKSIAIRVNAENERVILRFRSGRLYAEESFEHESCVGGGVIIRRVSKTHGVFFCAACKLRVHVSMPDGIRPEELSEALILKYFRKRFNTKPELRPCHLCGKLEPGDCSMCNPLPPKNKTSGK